MRSGGAVILILAGLFLGWLAVTNKLGCLKVSWTCIQTGQGA